MIPLIVGLVSRFFGDGKPTLSFRDQGVMCLGMIFPQILYIVALKFAPPAEVDILIYLWPILALGFYALILGHKIKTPAIVGALLGISALGVLFFGKDVVGGLSAGHFAAIGCAFSWALFATLSQSMKRMRLQDLPLPYTIGICVSLPLHLNFETSQWVTAGDIMPLAYFGFALTFGAYFLWTNALRAGPEKTLTVMAYGKPVCSLLLLCTFGFASMSITLGVSCLLIVLAGLTMNPFFRSFMGKLVPSPLRTAFQS